MATLAENKFVWDGDYDWPQQGDEWSGPWGGPTMQWHAEILPRIHSLIKGKRILEIACGYGRWTQFLIEAAAELTVVDLSQECIEACRARFDGANINFHLNDGTSLKIIETNSIDFIFSYDSLVHAELDVIKKYLSQFDRIMSAEGAAFIHHSNLAEYAGKRLKESDVHWRDPSVSAQLFAQSADQSGLSCIAQEVFGWDKTDAMIDCYSTVVKKASRRARANPVNVVYRNAEHAAQTKHFQQLSKMYPS